MLVLNAKQVNVKVPENLVSEFFTMVQELNVTVQIAKTGDDTWGDARIQACKTGDDTWGDARIQA